NVVFLCGCRYLDLAESLQMGFGTFFNNAADGPFAGTSIVRVDRFSTRNQFFGCDLGARGEIRFGSLFANLSGRIALGQMHESVNGNGAASTVSPLIGTLNANGGLYVQSTNMGRSTSNVFAAIPEVAVRIGMDLTDNIRVHVGYEFLYVSDVVRPGD